MYPPPNTYVAKPDNNLVWAILATLLCCVPVGAVSIYYAAKVDSAWMSGNTAAAYDYANKAKQWAVGSAIAGLAVGIVWFVFAALIGVSSGA